MKFSAARLTSPTSVNYIQYFGGSGTKSFFLSESGINCWESSWSKTGSRSGVYFISKLRSYSGDKNFDEQ